MAEKGHNTCKHHNTCKFRKHFHRLHNTCDATSKTHAYSENTCKFKKTPANSENTCNSKKHLQTQKTPALSSQHVRCKYSQHEQIGKRTASNDNGNVSGGTVISDGPIAVGGSIQLRTSNTPTKPLRYQSTSTSLS